LAASHETLRNEVRALVTAQQLAVIDKAIQSDSETIRGFLVETAAPAGQPFMPFPRLDVDRAMRALGLTGDALTGVSRAFGQHLDRVHLLATDRSALLRRMRPVLDAEELADFAASLERHKTIITHGP
jgi:hypothetical protein